MIKTLDQFGWTRDSALLWLAVFAGGTAYALDNFGLLQQAMPFLGPRAHAWIQILSAAVGGLGLYLRASPLAQSGTLGLRPDPERTLTASGKLPMVLLALALIGSSACASVNVKAEKMVRQAIQASEDNRCSVHPQPCLSDASFKATNGYLYKVSVAGEAYTKLAKLGTVKPADALTFAAAVESALQSIAILDSTGTVSGLLAKLNGVLNAAGAKP